MKKTYFPSLALLLGLMLLLAAACSPTQPATTTPPDASKNALAQAAGKTWKLDRWIGVDGGAQTTGAITIAFAFDAADGNLRASGNASVNRYTGPVNFTGAGETDFSKGFAATRMMGLPEPQAREDRYLAELRQVRAAALENGRLVLTGDGKLRMEFAPAPAPSPAPSPAPAQ